MKRTPEGTPAEVLADIAGALGAPVTVLGRLPGGINAGAVRVRLADGTDAVLKAEPRDAPDRLDGVLRARRIVERMRALGYPTPAWLGAGATAGHVWHVTELVDGAPPSELTPHLVEQLMAIVELQAGRGSAPPDHWAYAWRVVTGREPVVARLADRSPEVSALVARSLRLCGDATPPRSAPDMVHADLGPGNVLVRDGAVVALVDIGNAGRGTRATDLVTVLWHTFEEPLDEVRERLWRRILAVVGWRAATVLVATQILLQLEWPLRLAVRGVLQGVIERGHRALDELQALRSAVSPDP